MTAREQVDSILAVLPSLYKASNETWRFLRTELYDKGVSILRGKDLSQRQMATARQAFEHDILPRTTPMVLDSKHPLYRFENMKVYLVVTLERKGREMIGVASLHNSTPRLIRLPGGKKTHLILCEELLGTFADTVFPGFTVREKALVRVTRNADFDATIEDADDEFGFDFSRLIQNRVEGRTGSDVIRLESTELSEPLRSFLMKNLNIRKSHCFQIQGCFDYKFMFRLGDYIDYESVASLRYSAYRPVTPKPLSGNADLIAEVRKKDILLAYPYQSMDVLLNLLSQAAVDERVTSIKITIYRLADRSKIIEHLLKAAENGKEVVAVMELCARFDEENNLYNADLLRDAGCTVFYGIEDYKVHSKIISITLEEDGRIGYITHLGTGNYNESTAKQYTDLNIITADQEIGEDGAAAKGRDGLIRAKFNSLTDRDCIEKLIEASQAGCTVSLVVRGICCLVPGVPGLTENITVISIVGRFLEHSRIYAFGQEGQERVYIASADMMTGHQAESAPHPVPGGERQRQGTTPGQQGPLPQDPEPVHPDRQPGGVHQTGIRPVTGEDAEGLPRGRPCHIHEAHGGKTVRTVVQVPGSISSASLTPHSCLSASMYRSTLSVSLQLMWGSSTSPASIEWQALVSSYS